MAQGGAEPGVGKQVEPLPEGQQPFLNGCSRSQLETEIADWHVAEMPLGVVRNVSMHNVLQHIRPLAENGGASSCRQTARSRLRKTTRLGPADIVPNAIR
jgi:hypothetical protein